MTIPETMRAMVFTEPGRPLEVREVPVPEPGPGQVLIRIGACGVCRTDLHILDGELDEPKTPLIPGHQIAGAVVARGEGVDRFSFGDRVGVPWLGRTDGTCRYCRRGQENLCADPGFTGYTIDGGYADYAVADAAFAFALPDAYDDVEVAPLLCAGLIGYRTYRLAGEFRDRLGIYGFGSAGHLIAQVAIHEGREVYAFTRPGDTASQDFAQNVGAVWAGGSDEAPPVELDAAMIFAPVGPLVVAALKAVSPGGTVVSGGIHMSDVPAFPYSLLWEERIVRSVANLTRRDAEEFLEIAPQVPVKVTVHRYGLERANEALDALRAGEFEGSAVLVPGAPD